MPSYVHDGAGAPGRGSIYDPEKSRAKRILNGKTHRIWANLPKRSKEEIEAERAERAQKTIARLQRQKDAKMVATARLMRVHALTDARAKAKARNVVSPHPAAHMGSERIQQLREETRLALLAMQPPKPPPAPPQEPLSPEMLAWVKEGQARIDAADKARVEAHRKIREAAAEQTGEN